MKRTGWLIGAALVLSACGSGDPYASIPIAGNYSMQLYSGNTMLSGQLQVTLNGYNASAQFSDPQHGQLMFSGTRSLFNKEVALTSGTGSCNGKAFPLYSLHLSFYPVESSRGQGEFREQTCQDGMPIIDQGWHVDLR